MQPARGCKRRDSDAVAVDRGKKLPISEAQDSKGTDRTMTEQGGETTDTPDETEAVGQAEEGTEVSAEEHNGVESSEDHPGIPTISAESPTGMQELTVNGGQDRPKSASSTSSAQNRPGSIRSTSSKFASLRAAFEQGPSADSATDSAKRRLTSGDKSVDRVSERKQEYEAEITRLKDELEKERELRVAFEEKITSMEEGIEERDGEFEGRMMQMKTEAEGRLNAMASEARSRSQDASNLQKQLADLKRSVSTSTRTSPQVSDTTFRQEIDILQHEVQNWVVNNFRRVKIEDSPDELCDKIERVAEPKQLTLLRPMYKAFDAAVKLPIYQATVACYMMEIFDEPFLFGLQGQRDWAKRLRQAAEGISSVLDSGTYNRWRANTFDALRQSDGIKEPLEKAATGIAEMICITLQAITDVEESEPRLTSLKTIIHRAITIAHLIRVQQAQYQFILSSPEDQFDPSSMDDISEETDAEAGRTIRCATFPAIIKLSDEDGDELEEKNIVVRAKVLCQDSETSAPAALAP